jgi:hypothetical protein
VSEREGEGEERCEEKEDRTTKMVRDEDGEREKAADKRTMRGEPSRPWKNNKQERGFS